MLDPSLSAEEFEAGVRIAESVAARSEDEIGAIPDRPEVDALLHVLIPGLQPLEGFPANPNEVALDFVTGWSVAEAELSLGLAAPGMISRSAQMALSMVRPSTETAGFATATWQSTDLGYCVNRLTLSPRDALIQVQAATLTA